MDKTKQDIEYYLSDVKKLIGKNRYRIARNPNRLDNEDLFLTYVLDEAAAKNILLSLSVEDFSEVVQNRKPGYGHEWLCIFGKTIRLLSRFGQDEREVSLYIKFNKIEDQYVIVISFHEQKHPMVYAFK